MICQSFLKLTGFGDCQYSDTWPVLKRGGTVQRLTGLCVEIYVLQGVRVENYGNEAHCLVSAVGSASVS